MRWVELEQAGERPEERSSHTVNYVEGKLYLFGGEHDPRVPVNNTLHVYDLGSHQWSKVAVSGATPSPRVAQSGVVIGSNIWYFGGRSGIEMGEGAKQDLYKFDTRTNTWEEVSSRGPAPASRSFHTACAHANKMYVFGGCGQSGRLNDLWCFNTETCEWAQLPTHESIKGRGGSRLVASEDGSKLYVLCGFCGHELSDMYEYDVGSGEWREIATDGLPPRSVFGTMVHFCDGVCGHPGHLLAFGGEVDPSTLGHAGAGDFTDEIYCWHKDQGWHKVATPSDAQGKPCPRGWFASTPLPGGGGLVVHGGLDCSNKRLGDLFILKMHDD